MWIVRLLPEAEEELAGLPAQEVGAMNNAVNKLKAVGPQLGWPHTSAVAGVPGTLRELRPRQGRSPYRGLYRQVGHEFVIAAIAPDGKTNRNGFNRAAQRALERLQKLEEG
jgi:hypothetical protein